MLDLEPDLSQVPTAMIGAIGAYPEDSVHAFEMRTFAPGAGVDEDPACGSMNASVGQWLLGTGAIAGSYRVSEGTRVGRAGEIRITPDAESNVWISGATNTLFRGVAEI